jgi:hypothetical protein
MDVERTIEFIVDMQAKAEARMDKFDKRLEATRKLVEAGMRILVNSQKEHAEWKKEMGRTMKELAESQKKTDLKLDRLIDFWAKQRTNGHKK